MPGWRDVQPDFVGNLDTTVEAEGPVRARKTWRVIAIEALGPVTILAGIVWAFAQPYRIASSTRRERRLRLSRPAPDARGRRRSRVRGPDRSGSGADLEEAERRTVQPRPELAHWLFASLFLLIGLRSWRRRSWARRSSDAARGAHTCGRRCCSWGVSALAGRRSLHVLDAPSAGALGVGAGGDDRGRGATRGRPGKLVNRLVARDRGRDDRLRRVAPAPRAERLAVRAIGVSPPRDRLAAARDRRVPDPRNDAPPAAAWRVGLGVTFCSWPCCCTPIGTSRRSSGTSPTRAGAR